MENAMDPKTRPPAPDSKVGVPDAPAIPPSQDSREGGMIGEGGEGPAKAPDSRDGGMIGEGGERPAPAPGSRDGGMIGEGNL
jgi:hypothetical protein